jgi:RNA polymerase sigma factor (sigma-70 family)
MPEPSFSDIDQSWQRLIDGLRSGDDAVLREFHQQYGHMLFGIAEARVSPSMRPRFDADDVVQSTLRTFFRRAQTSYFQFEDSQQLWNLLCAILLTKVREKVRFHTRYSRSVNREQGSAAFDESSVTPENRLLSFESPPDVAAAFSEALANLLASLDESDQRLIQLKLQDLTNDEAAEALGVHERTVRRMLDDLRERIEKLLDG